ncbi:TonB-dependent receptor [Sphingosinicella sp. BN140058]|uniref:TonB-dependent receptor n=1 Tax=Sphingosinicella sp. BN140058 TaxID=1892855 RepID=UPI001012E815|nr:TonB-dependent receptor [Sphingosinicella sp. BN140058]QAY75334.1 TonB-dependent receptor [Sphingosinicella sp. BN140058]
MRLKTCALCSTSLVILTLSTAPAFAQGQAAPPDPAVQAQESPADADAGAVQTDGAVETAGQSEEQGIVVTGLRRSLQSAQNLKRNSEQQIDAIVAEDIGKLPDIAVSDTAARIPGIQVERAGGEASRVLVRGLDRTYYTTTYNGREIFTAETRSVALQDFPSGAIAAVEAFKTSSANLVEPGIAGLINVRSRRPFDFKGLEVAGSVWGVYPNQSRDFSPNANLLISNRWDTGMGEIGALLNVSYTQLHYRDSIRRHGFFIADLAGGRAPDWPEIRYNEANRWRPSVNGALQWRPSPGLEFYVEGLWQGFREEAEDRMWAQPLWGGTHTNVVFRDGSNAVESGTVVNPGAPGETWGFQGGTYRKTDTYQFAIGGSYDAGALRISGDLARTDSTFNLETESVDYEINTNAYSVDYVIGAPGGPGPTLRVNGIDPSNAAIYNYRGFYEDYLTAKGKDWQARLDFEYEPGLDFLPKVEWGVRYVDRNASSRRGDRYWNFTARACCGNHAPIPLSAVPLDYRLFQSGFRGDDDRPFPKTWLAPTYDSIRKNLVELRQFNITQGTASRSNTTDDPDPDPTRGFDINEKSYAAYAQLGFRFDAGFPIDGNVGLRAVKTKERIEGVVSAPGVAPTPITFENDYTDWLPNISLRAQFTPELQLRLAATQTRTRPTFEQLNPALNLGSPITCSPGASDCVRRGTGGNPFLKPLTSNNYDASLEYYFANAGFASVAVFRRDMRGFIANTTFEYPDPDPATGQPLLITGPVNTRKARIDGFEAQVSTFFDFDFLPQWAHGFGAQANATYVDAKADFTLFENAPSTATPTNQVTRRLRIPDVSKWTYNLVGMYEGGGFSARLSYNLRSRYPEGDLGQRDNNSPNPYTLQGNVRPISRLDWSSSYAFNDNLTVFLDWTNILKNPFKSDIVRINYQAGAVTGDPEVFPLVYRFEESVVSGGVRFRF